MADDFGLIGCGQIEAEVHHDELPIDKPYLDKTLDALQNYCGNFAQKNHPRFTDPGFVKHIFNTPTTIGEAKQYLYDRGLSTPTWTGQAQQVTSHAGVNPVHVPPGTQLPAKYIYYKGQVINPTQGSSYLATANYIGSINSFEDPINNPISMRELINTIIAHCNVLPVLPPSSGPPQQPSSGPPQHLYLFIDTALNLIEAMNKAMTLHTDPILNVINSQISLADSATGGKNIYNTLFYTNRLKSWWFQKDIVVPPYGVILQSKTFPLNLIFHTSLTCELSDAGAQEWSDKKITQKWSDSTFTPPVITNANKQNTKGAVRKAFSASTTIKNKSWCYQRKRSGDGFQIWFIYYFSYFLSNFDTGPFFCTCKDGTEQYYPTTQDLLPASNNTNDIRARSFFVTIDFPAFCWAAYCHMNVILLHPDGNVTLFIANPAGYAVLPVS